MTPTEEVHVLTPTLTRTEEVHVLTPTLTRTEEVHVLTPTLTPTEEVRVQWSEGRALLIVVCRQNPIKCRPC